MHVIVVAKDCFNWEGNCIVKRDKDDSLICLWRKFIVVRRHFSSCGPSLETLTFACLLYHGRAGGVTLYLYEKNKKRWNVHDQILTKSKMQQDLKDPERLQIRASNWGLCNLLSAVESYLRGSSEDLFDDVDKRPAIKKRRTRRISSTSQPAAVPHCLHLELGSGTLIVMWPARIIDDLHIKYTAEQVQLFLDYMMEASVKLEGERRP